MNLLWGPALSADGLQDLMDTLLPHLRLHLAIGLILLAATVGVLLAGG